jgi:hypothetical protein
MVHSLNDRAPLWYFSVMVFEYVEVPSSSCSLCQ